MMRGESLRPLWSLFLLFLLCFTAQAQTSALRTAYELDSGDFLEIQVYGESDLSPKVRVGDDGTIPYPFLGEIQVSGLTAPELEDLITDRLRGDYLVDPRVSVAIVEYRPFFINGQVNSPGGYPFRPGLTVRKAVSVAGGFTERASQSKIFVTREGDAERHRLELDDLVGPGDVLTVEESFF